MYFHLLGTPRSYCHIIRHELDFAITIAGDAPLIPQINGKHVQFEEFADFIGPFADILDCEVATRYTYGSIRLTWLNNIAVIFSGRLTYFHDQGQWREQMGTIVAPLIIGLGLVSIAMTAMQVELGMDALGWQQIWPGFLGTFRWTPAVVVTLLLATFVIIVVFVGVSLGVGLGVYPDRFPGQECE